MYQHPELPIALTVDVIIPTWNRRDLVLTCLAALAGQDVRHSVVVVDNASQDGTAESVRAGFPEAAVVEMPANVGFGRAVNAGVWSASGEIVVVINNDVLVEPGFLSELCRAFESEPAVSAVAGVLLDAEGVHIDAAGIEVDGGLAGYSYLHGCPQSALKGAAAPLGPTGGAAAYRRSAFRAVDGFDEEMFAYSEDVDLALRMADKAMVCGFAPLARARHLGSATLGRRTVAQLERSAWSRGYLLGRYRVPARWVLLEAAVGMLDCGLTRSVVPARSRLDGFRRGRRLPARMVPSEAFDRRIPLKTGMASKWHSVRGA